jgi:ubiquinone/menaquinone biosynthesis C-methylase UbiE
MKLASELHGGVPPDWYYQSIKKNMGQCFWHKRRFEEVKKLTEPVEGLILDIGSADGVFTKVILDKTKAKKIIGIDVLKNSVDWANKHWQRNKRMKFKVGDAHKLEFKARSFDAVFALEVLEHVYDPDQVLREVKRVLKKNGYALFLVPTDSLLFRLIWFLWTKMRGRVWKETHIKTYRNNYLPKICQKAGFRVEKNHKFLLGMLQIVKIRKAK